MSKTKVLYNPSVLNKLEGRNVNGAVQTQNVRSGRVYIFGKDSSTQLCVEDDEDEDEDVVFEMVKVRPRKGKNGSNNEEKSTDETKKAMIITRPVFPNDTLSKFALQYGCMVAELKQANGLYSDQDFHALKHIKIPIKPHSLLTERAEEERRRENAFNEHEDTKSRSRQSDNSDSDYENIDEGSSSSRPNVRTVSISANLKDPEKFLKKMDDDIQKICQSVSAQRPDENDINRRLTTHCIHPRTARKKSTEELGTIWTGFGWKGAVIAFIFVAIILPLLYFIYIEKIK